MEIKNFGGERLGAEKKAMTQQIRDFARSTHDIGKVTRTSMAIGTLVPTYFEPVQVGDVLDIKLDSLTKTMPTIAPIMGVYKQQTDVFFCPIRLYNGLLHNNATALGLNMNKVKFPRIELQTKVLNPVYYNNKFNTSQISSSSLWAYLGVRGLGMLSFQNGESEETLTREVNALGPLMYWDIYKNYYANKQEKEGVVVAGDEDGASQVEIIKFNFDISAGHLRKGQLIQKGMEEGLVVYQPLSPDGNPMEINSQFKWWFYFNGDLEKESIKIETTSSSGLVAVTSIFNGVFFDNNNNVLILSNPNSTYYGDEFVSIAFTGIGETKDVKLERFPLENLDTMRYKILQNTGLNNRFWVNNPSDQDLQNIAPYSALWRRDVNGFLVARQSLVGLGIKTYQSDILNNWLNTEDIELATQAGRVSTTTGSFSMESLLFAEHIWQTMQRVILAGSTYEDWLETVFTEQVPKRLESPIYIGGMSRRIVFEEVVSTAAAEQEFEEKPLGTLAGKGSQTDKRGGDINFHVSEPGFIMAITSITPYIDYSQGNKFYTDWEDMDDLHKPTMDGIGYEDLMLERFSWWGRMYQDAASDQINLAVGKVPAWLWWMTNINETYGDFAIDEPLEFMALNRNYELNTNEDGTINYMNPIKDLTTYIDPIKFNYAFANADRKGQNFWVQIGQDITVRRKISAKIAQNI